MSKTPIVDDEEKAVIANTHMHGYMRTDTGRRLESDRAELIEALGDLLKWGIDSKSVKGAMVMAALHGATGNDETPYVVAAIDKARALLARLEGK